MSFAETGETEPLVHAEDVYGEMYHQALGAAIRPVDLDSHEMAIAAVNTRIHVAQELFGGRSSHNTQGLYDSKATAYLFLLTFGPQPE